MARPAKPRWVDHPNASILVGGPEGIDIDVVQTSKGWFPRLNIHPGEAHADRESAKKSAIANTLKDAANRLAGLRDLKKALSEDEGNNGQPAKAMKKLKTAEAPKAEEAEPKFATPKKDAKPAKPEKGAPPKKGKPAKPEKVTTVDDVLDEDVEVVEGSDDKEAPEANAEGFEDDDFSEFDNDLDA